MSDSHDRILNPQVEFSPLFPAAHEASGETDFWDQYFELQEVVEDVSARDGSFSLQVTNHQTGETVTVQNVRLLVDTGSDR